jgi:hypothetical protein
MEQTSIRAVEMVRAIRDRIYEETKDFSREELKEFFAREAAAMRQELQDDSGTDGQAAAGASARR